MKKLGPLWVGALFLCLLQQCQAISDSDADLGGTYRDARAWIDSRKVAMSASTPDLHNSNQYIPTCRVLVDGSLAGRYQHLGQLCSFLQLVAREALQWIPLDGNRDSLDVTFKVRSLRNASDSIRRSHYVESGESHRSPKAYRSIIDLRVADLSTEPEIFAAAFHETGHSILNFLIKHSVPAFQEGTQYGFIGSPMQEFLSDLLSVYLTGSPELAIQSMGPVLSPTEFRLHLMSSPVTPEEIMQASNPNYEFTGIKDPHNYFSPLHETVFRLYRDDPTLEGYGRIVKMFLAKLPILQKQYAGRDIYNVETCRAINSDLSAALLRR